MEMINKIKIEINKNERVEIQINSPKFHRIMEDNFPVIHEFNHKISCVLDLSQIKRLHNILNAWLDCSYDDHLYEVYDELDRVIRLEKDAVLTYECFRELTYEKIPCPDIITDTPYPFHDINVWLDDAINKEKEPAMTEKNMIPLLEKYNQIIKTEEEVQSLMKKKMIQQIPNDNSQQRSEFLIDCVFALDYLTDAVTYTEWKKRYKTCDRYKKKLFPQIVIYLLSTQVIHCRFGEFDYNMFYYTPYCEKYKRAPNFCLEHIQYFEKWIQNHGGIN